MPAAAEMSAKRLPRTSVRSMGVGLSSRLHGDEPDGWSRGFGEYPPATIGFKNSFQATRSTALIGMKWNMI
jgi:hypothetical protein